MRARAFPCAVFLALAAMIPIVAARASFVEEVLIERLRDDAVALVFTFTTTEHELERHSAVMAKPLRAVLAKSRAETLELWFGRGRWNARRWGAPPVVAKPIGAEALGTWRADEDAERGWRDATTALGGTFCASLSALGTSTAVTSPVLGFNAWDGEASSARRARDPATVKHASLPQEAVCVENLAPWLKQLPCRDRAGLAKALKTAHEVFSARHLTFGVRLSKDGDGYTRSEQTLMMVLPDASESYAEIIGTIQRVASDVCVAADGSYVHARDGDDIATFNLSSSAAFDADALGVNHRTPTLYVERFLTGTGNEFGGIVIDIERPALESSANSSPPIRARLFQPLPWFVKLYMHTLSIELDGVAVSREVLDEMHFVPAEDRVRSSLLELQMVLPANASMLRLRLDFDKGFLRAQEFPPDANRGFDLPPARFDAFRVIHADTRVPRTQQASAFLDKLRASSVAPETLYMNSLLLLLPTPDFSMTFNVAAMTGSVLSILFLSLMRAMTARESWKDYRR